MQEASAPRFPSLIKLGKLANAKKFDQLEELWAEAIGAPEIDREDLLAVAGQVGRLGSVEKADELALLVIAGGRDPAHCLDLARVAGRQIPDGVGVRKELRRLYLAVHADFPQLPGLVDLFCKGEAPLDTAVVRLDAYLALRPGSYAVDYNFVAPGIVESVNATNGVIVVRFQNQRGEYGPATLGKISPRAADYFPALVLYDPDRLRELAGSDPAAFVKLALKAEHDQRLSYKDLKLHVTRLLGEKGWGSWWRRSRDVLKRDPMLALSTGSQPTLRSLRQADRYEDRLRRRFDRTDEPAEKLKQVLAYLDETTRAGTEHQADPGLLTHFGNGAAKTAVVSLKENPVLALAALAVHAEVARRGGEVATPNPRAAQQVLARIPDHGALAVELPDALVQPTLEYVRETTPEDWDRVWAAAMLRGGKRLADFCARVLIEAGRVDALRATLIRAVSKPTASAELITWLWRVRAGGGPVARALADVPELAPYPVLVAFLVMTEAIGHLHGVAGEDRHLKVLEAARADLVVDGAQPVVDVIRNASSDEAQRLKDLTIDNLGLPPSLRSRLRHMLRGEHPELFTEIARPWEDETILYSSDQGMRQRQDQLTEIIEVGIPEVAKQIGEAASFGDLSENSEFTAALEKRDQLASRATTMERELKMARAIGPDLSLSPHANIGTRVTARNVVTGEDDVFTFLGPWDGDAERKILFYRAPLALAFMGRKVGETVTYGEGLDRREWQIKGIEPAV
jgi:transcription elongation GreA/GreB family factor